MAPERWLEYFQATLNQEHLHVRKADLSFPAHHETWDCPLKFDHEICAAVEQVFGIVKDELKKEHFPIILGGDHCVSLATATAVSAHIGEKRLGALVFDAHTDFNLPGRVWSHQPQLPEVGYTISGNAHGMIHALLGGLSDPAYETSSFCRKHSKLDPNRVCVIGVRANRYPDLNETLTKARPLLITAEEIHRAGVNGVGPLMEKALARVTDKFREPFYLSIDCDVLDPADFPAVGTPVAGGLSLNQLVKCWEKLAAMKPFSDLLLALDLSEYCPHLDRNIPACGLELAQVLVAKLFPDH